MNPTPGSLLVVLLLLLITTTATILAFIMRLLGLLWPQRGKVWKKQSPGSPPFPHATVPKVSASDLVETLQEPASAPVGISQE